MQIEVLTSRDSPNKDKGDLLEALVEKLVRTRGYEVVKQVRVTGAELDLLCRDKVSGKEIYVECKAHRENLSASVLRSLMGTISLKNYSEGWLISTGPFGKDAKGVIDEWEKKPSEQRAKLSFYSTERVLDALLSARLIVEAPVTKARSECCSTDRESIGDWILLISTWGYFWAVPVLKNGVPERIALFETSNGNLISDQNLFDRIRSSDFSARELAFFTTEMVEHDSPARNQKNTEINSVIQVEHGEKWSDYRPARPDHFVGRKKAQQELMQLFTRIKTRRTDTRVFAIKGDSGIGKSSLVAKLRDTANASQKPNRLFFYAVDVRAANDATYIHSALLAALNEASNSGFGKQMETNITNYSAPLESASIRQFLEECAKKKELIILVFDQFEELYSKPGLLSVFNTTKSLMFSALASSTSIVLGFAWKTDTAIPQEHPAYHMWHELSDHRFEIQLGPFTHADAINSLAMFENELGERIRPELRNYLIESSQGYPWLLKKLCIHFNEQVQAGVGQEQLADIGLDIASLFDRDMNDLSEAQLACLKYIAQNAPIDWFEVLQITDSDVVRSLQEKRLIIRRGDKLNLYWDIFGDYVLTGAIPNIPFTHIPQSPSMSALLKVALELDEVEGKTIKQLAEATEFKESTVWNILRDLEQFGITHCEKGWYEINPHISVAEPEAILSRIRFKLRRHALTECLSTNNDIKAASTEQIIQYLKELNPTAQHRSRTLRTYANKMVNWLEAVGLVKHVGTGYIYQDSGCISPDIIKRLRQSRRRTLFIGDASPAKVVEALDLLKQGSQRQTDMGSKGYRNACAVLFRFGLTELVERSYQVTPSTYAMKSSTEAVWNSALQEEALKYVVGILRESPNISSLRIGRMVADQFSRDWTESTWKRVGNSLRQWGSWLLTPVIDGLIPLPPGRTEKRKYHNEVNLLNYPDVN